MKTPVRAKLFALPCCISVCYLPEKSVCSLISRTVLLTSSCRGRTFSCYSASAEFCCGLCVVRHVWPASECHKSVVCVPICWKVDLCRLLVRLQCGNLHAYRICMSAMSAVTHSCFYLVGYSYFVFLPAGYVFFVSDSGFGSYHVNDSSFPGLQNCQLFHA